MGRFGIDYAWHNDITDAVCKKMKAAGVTFVGRYFSNNSDSKNLSHDEAKVLSRNGIDIVCFWESTATRAEDGFAAGVADARKALAEHTAVGMPNDRPIYFAIDEDTTVGPHITGYFKGVASVIGLSRTGVYGSYRVVKALFDNHLVKWAFQTYAWSGGLWDHRAQFHQYSNGHTLAGISCDYDTAVASDFGQWRIGPAPKPAAPDKKPVKPPKKPKPVKPAVVPHPPHDVEGRWPFGRHDYLGPTSRDNHCHSGFLAKDRPHIEAFQHQMQVRGWKISRTGRYDAQTAKVVREFQKQCGIAQDGLVGHDTWDHARHTPVT